MASSFYYWLAAEYKTTENTCDKTVLFTIYSVSPGHSHPENVCKHAALLHVSRDRYWSLSVVLFSPFY